MLLFNDPTIERDSYDRVVRIGSLNGSDIFASAGLVIIIPGPENMEDRTMNNIVDANKIEYFFLDIDCFNN
jgi:hypothetical protein